jgi:hypothetical protein
MTKSDKILSYFANLSGALFFYNIILGLVRGWWYGSLDGTYLIAVAIFAVSAMFHNKGFLESIIFIAGIFIASIIGGIFIESTDDLFGLWFRFNVNWILLVAISGVIWLSLFLYQRHRKNLVKST